MNQKKVPHLFVATGADKWGDYQHFPWTIGFQPSYRTEAQIYTKYILANVKDPKIAILYQNDDFGKDYPAGVKDVLGDKFDKMVSTATYETTDATVDSPLTSLQASGANVLLVVADPEIRRAGDPQGLRPGLEAAIHHEQRFDFGRLRADPGGAGEGCRHVHRPTISRTRSDPNWANDKGMQEWRDFMAKNMPGADLTDASYVYAYSVSKTMLQVLQQCNGDFSRANVMKQATNLHDFEVPTLLPGIKVSTSPTNYHPIRALQMMRWDGKTWVLFGPVIEGASS